MEKSLQKELALKTGEYLKNKRSSETFAEKADALKAELKESVTKHGDTDPNTGTQIISFEYQGQKFDLRNTARNSAKLVGDAVEILKKDPKLKKYVIKETIERVDEEALQADIKSGKFPAKDVSKVYGSQTVYAFTAKIK